MAGPWEKYQQQAQPQQAAGGPWEKYQAQASDQPEQDKGAAALQGAGQGLSFGYLPQLQAMAEPLTTRAFNAVTGNNVEVPSFKQMVPGSDEYIKARDVAIARDQQLQKGAPLSYGAGQAAGLLTSAAIPGAALAKGAEGVGLGSAILQGAKAGAVTSAIQNPGDVQGQAGPQINERIQNAISGGAVGGAFGGAGNLVGKAAKYVGGIPEKLENFSNEMAFRQLGPTKKDVKGLMMKEGPDQAYKKIRELGEFVRDRGLVKGGEGIEDVANRVSQYQQDTGQKIGDLYDRVSEQLGQVNPAALPDKTKVALQNTALRPKDIAKEVTDDITKAYTGKSGGRQAVNAVTNELENLKDLGNEPVSIKSLFDYRKSLDRKIYDKTTDNITQDALKDVRKSIAEKINDRIAATDGLLGTNESSALKKLNKEYGLIAKAHDMSQDQLASEMKNKFFSLTDKMVGIGAGIHEAGSENGNDNSDFSLSKLAQKTGKSVATGLIAAGASKAARHYGAPLAMQGPAAVADLANGVKSFISQNAANMTPAVVKDMYDGFSQRYGKELAQKIFTPSVAGSIGAAAYETKKRK